MINYLKEVIAFEDWLETNPLEITTQILWYRLIAIANKSGWPEWFTVANITLQAKTGGITKATLIKHRNFLAQKKLIIYLSQGKQQAGKYKLLSVGLINEPNLEPNLIPNPIPKCIPNSIPLFKLNETKQIKELKEPPLYSPKGERTHFKSPKLEEVIAYCEERKNNVDAGKWYDFYVSKGWMIGKTKMKDWKAAVRTWERSNSTESNQKGAAHAKYQGNSNTRVSSEDSITGGQVGWIGKGKLRVSDMQG